jgi:uncharacterized protein (TIGR02246 family)
MATRPAVEEAEIRGRIDELIEAVRAMDLEAVKPLYAPDMVSFDLGPPLQHVGAEAKWKNWVEFFTVFQRPVDYEIHDLKITADGDVAFAHSLNQVSATLRNGDRMVYWVRGTICFRKVDGSWLIAHDHVSVPLEVGSGRALLDLEP